MSIVTTLEPCPDVVQCHLRHPPADGAIVQLAVAGSFIQPDWEVEANTSIDGHPAIRNPAVIEDGMERFQVAARVYDSGLEVLQIDAAIATDDPALREEIEEFLERIELPERPPPS